MVLVKYMVTKKPAT